MSKRQSLQTFKRWLPHIAVVVLAIVAGFIVTGDGPLFYDDGTRYAHSRFLLWKFGLGPEGPVDPHVRYYGTLFELILGVCTEILLPWLHDHFWVRHALTFALYLLSLYAVWHLLRRGGMKKSTTFLCIAGLVGIIRLGGHALFNMKDMPGAMTHLVCCMAIWHLLRRGQANSWRLGTLISIGLVGVVPFLVRSPLLLALLLGAAGAGIMTEGSLRHRAKNVAIPLLAAGIVWIVLSPGYWDLSLWRNPISYFRNYPDWNESVRVFGKVFPGSKAPWWYPFVWIPIMMEPLALLGAIGGGMMLHRASADTPLLRYPGKKRGISLADWIGLVALMSWATVLIVHPKIYNEERHLLFLYPPLILFCYTGFSYLTSDRLKYGIASVILAASAISYASWGRYSYVYKSPIIGAVKDGDFTADYWGICIGEAFSHLPELVEPGFPLQLDTVSEHTQRRFRKSLVFKREGYDYPLHSDMKRLNVPTWANIMPVGKLGGWERMMQVKQVRESDHILWKRMLPDGETACAVVLRKRQ